MQRYLTVRHVRHRADVEVVIASGEIDLYTVSLVREALRDTEQRRVPRVFLDLSEVGFLSVVSVRIVAAAAEQGASIWPTAGGRGGHPPGSAGVGTNRRRLRRSGDVRLPVRCHGRPVDPSRGIHSGGKRLRRVSVSD
ncbi:STAS domain-containing protein [Qaidamihabitans albus]|uniref:STAS domain-containing protein n=1 Tax=Qaidamihabitans albus TaxID=2795733 RepID=UPI0018F13904|nr:STAS domain-containing protein [Qaidamihabitans albus]